MESASNFFSKAQLQKIVNAIQKAEISTHGEIRVHLSNECKEDVLNKAWEIFEQLEMHKTEHRSGVLVFIAVKDKKIAIIGDEGINQFTPENYWDTALEKLSSAFQQNEFLIGILQCIEGIGEKLKTHFPSEDNQNELPNEVSFD